MTGRGRGGRAEREAGGVRAVLLPVREEADVAVARLRARAVALAQGLTEPGAAAVATAVSEVARNIVVHAGEGEIAVSPVEDQGRRGVRVVARDRHPGMPDVELALRDGYSTARTLGLGLAGAKRLMDEFTVVSAVGEGTTVTMHKWAHGPE